MDEYIDREAYIKSLQESYNGLKQVYSKLDDEQEKKICEGQLITFMECILRIKGISTTDVAPIVRGEWIGTPDGTVTICSYCKADWNVFDNETGKFSYCPNCGAKMDLE